MKTKLTLSIDKELIQFAKQHAQRNGESVSSMFSELLLAQKSEFDTTSPPKISAMVGSLKRYDIDDSKENIRAAYAKKYPFRS